MRVLQTYDEIGQAVENAVVSVLLPDNGQQAPPEPTPEWYERQVEEDAKRIRDQVLSGLDGEDDDAREVQRLTQIILDARKALDHLDGVIALETWDDDEIPAAVRGAALAVRFRLERLHPDFHRSDAS